MQRSLYSLFGVLTIIVFFPALLLPQDGMSPWVNQTSLDNHKPPLSQIETKQNVQTNLDWGKMPVYFIENRGQMDASVLYYIQGSDKTIYFTREGVTFALTAELMGAERKAEDLVANAGNVLELTNRGTPQAGQGNSRSYTRWAVKLNFLGANPTASLEAQQKQPMIVSYFKGNSEQWHTGLSTYTRLVYHELWPGIDLVYQGTTDRLKYEFVVQPGADPRLIQLAYQGATGVKVNPHGQLEVSTPLGGFRDDTPLAYQELNGKKVEVMMAFALQPSVTSTEARFGFSLGNYDATRPLILDPALLVYCGYIGGSGDERGYGIAVDSSGAAYLTGSTFSGEATFPVISGPDLTFNGLSDAFIVKVNAEGSGLIYAGYIGGSSTDWGTAIAVDETGFAYILGNTLSNEETFPVIGGPDLTYNYAADVFIAKVKIDGSGLIFAGYIGGSSDDYGAGIAVDSFGAAYVTGQTNSDQTTFPVLGGPGLTYSGATDAFIAKVKANGSSLVYAGYIGGSASDFSSAIAVDGNGAAYIAGGTSSSEASFPVIGGPGLTFKGYTDAFVTKVRVNGSGLVYSGYIGGADHDQGMGVAVDISGAAYVTGYTYSNQSSFPVVGGPDLTYNYLGDAFVAKVKIDGTGLVYAGYIGGSSDDEGYAIAVDDDGAAYITGYTRSDETSFPVIGGPDLTFNENQDAFVAKVRSDGSGFVYAGYIGGSGADYGRGIAVDNHGQAYITGDTDSNQTSFPVVGGPDLSYNGGVNDVFIAKLPFKFIYIFMPLVAR